MDSESFSGQLHHPVYEVALSYRQRILKNGMSILSGRKYRGRVVFCGSKDHEATGSARPS